MPYITISAISGFTFPYSIYVCNSYERDCILISTINKAPVSLRLPFQFNSAPVVGIKVMSSNNCSKFESVICHWANYGKFENRPCRFTNNNLDLKFLSIPKYDEILV